MNIFQSVMMYIGILSCIAWLYRIAKKIAKFISMLLEEGFRNRFPLDFLINISWATDIFSQYGFGNKGKDYRTSTPEKPGIILKRQDNEAQIYLIAPLDGEQKIEVIVKKPAINIILPAKKTPIYENLLHHICANEIKNNLQ